MDVDKNTSEVKKNCMMVWTRKENARKHILLLLLKALQLPRSFGLLNEFFPFGPVSDAVLPIYFHFCYITFYIIFSSIFRSS
jgi:hypothetical protein